MKNDFLLEIGTEEIPAGFLARAIPDLREMGRQWLETNRLAWEDVETWGTPRRITLVIRGLADSQGDLVEDVTGPPRSVALDAEGRPTKALEKFCARYGADPEDVSFVQKGKGEYVCLKKIEKGRKTEELLQALLPEFILGIPFAKSMRWGDLDVRFARPIRWIVCLYGDTPVVFSVGDVTSGTLTQGHRFMSDGAPVEVDSIGRYKEVLREACVVLDPEERRQTILKNMITLSDDLGIRARIEEEESFIDTLVFLTEFPVPVMGAFDERFLELPEEVLAESMKSHLKYLPVRNQEAKGLLPYFVAVSNTQPSDMGLIRRGMERVLKARLEDARFFFREDTRTPLEDNAEALRKVIFHKKIGTSYEKVQRIGSLGTFLGQSVVPDALPTIERAARLCKADLVTQMVGEFPELQGIMGGIYAAHSGEPEAVSLAIREHYMPVSAEGTLPESDAGSVVSLADKMDTVVAFFRDRKHR